MTGSEQPADLTAFALARLADEIADRVRRELSRERPKDRLWAIPLGATADRLRSLGAGCAVGRWVCRTPDATRNSLRT